MNPESLELMELTKEPKIAYFSMEIGIHNSIPTYSGGLGVLAGDTIKSGADLNLPMVAVTLLSEKGYFRQELDAKGRQTEHPVIWDPAKYMTLLSPKISVEIEGRKVLDPGLALYGKKLYRRENTCFFPRHRCGRKFPRGSRNHFFSLWERPGLPFKAGNRPGYRRGADAKKTGF